MARRREFVLEVVKEEDSRGIPIFCGKVGGAWLHRDSSPARLVEATSERIWH